MVRNVIAPDHVSYTSNHMSARLLPRTIASRLLAHLPAKHLRRGMANVVGAQSNRASSEAWPSLPEHQEDAVFPPPPPPPSDELPSWTEAAWSSRPLDITRRIFCNRSLNMRSIRAVGLDLDYTLAQYRPETFEVLAHTETVKKLVDKLHYPEVLKDWRFDWRYMTRGLIIDKKRGNVLKADKHKYVKIAYHGFQEMKRDDRLKTYNSSNVRFSFDEPDFAMIDTLFSLAEAHLFMQLVELHDSKPELLPRGKDFSTMYRDVREAVDLCHRDGSIKQVVAQDPGRFVHQDLRLLPMLRDLRAAGKQLFICTNSQWDYTHVLMNYLISGRVGADKNDDWLSHFEVVFTGCGKPGFFHAPKAIFEVQTSSGLLSNTDGGTPMAAIGQEQPQSPPPAAPTSGFSAVEAGCAGGGKARVFQGGTFLDLHRMLGVNSGAEVLYVGDHIYSDVLLSKKTLGWRTMLVVPELESEIRILQGCGPIAKKLLELRDRREELDDQIEHLQWEMRGSADPPSTNGSGNGNGGNNGSSNAGGDSSVSEKQQALKLLEEQRDRTRRNHSDLLDRHHRRFHPVWGQLTKSGYANSQFAHQLERFACVYTSHVANLTFCSPYKTHRARYNIMSHECDLDLPSPVSHDREHDLAPPAVH